jgi:UDP-N-acetylmuramoylalanine--D-glutamate ligase
MVVPEHLNWHTNMDEYILAKANLFKHQNQDDTAVFFAQNDLSKKIVGYSPGHKIPYFANPGAYIADQVVKVGDHTICDISDIKLLGKHNWENICAAVTIVWQITQNIDAMRDIITSFSGLPHRLEMFRETLGIKYYNDSFASTPDSAIAAMEAISDNKVMILGGFDRKLPLEHLAKAASNHSEDIRKVIIIGNCAPRLAEEFEKAGFSNYFIDASQNMREIVATANTFAHNGDAVVLSPGFPSFDMFKNFEDRGNQFKDAVNAL